MSGKFSRIDLPASEGSNLSSDGDQLRRMPLLRRLRISLGRSGSYVFVTAAIILLLIAIAGILAPLLFEADPNTQNLIQRYQAPSLEHPMGTDALGRDVFIRVVYGARTSLGIAVAAAMLSAVSGAALGFTGGFLRGRVDQLIVRSVDILMAFPTVLLAIVIITVIGGGILNLILAIVISSWPQFVRIARSAALTIGTSGYVEASRSMGATSFWQLTRHVVPNGIPLIVVLTTARMGTVILIESSLSFLGLGVSPGTPSWGAMISDGREVLREAPWLSLAPGIAIMVSVLCFNLIGDGLRDLIDPQMRNTGVGQ